MRFEDHILTYLAKLPGERGFDQVAAQRRIDTLCLAMVTMLSQGSKFLSLALNVRAEVKRTVMGAGQALRYELKLHMLRLPAWRYRVIKDLGGVEKLIRLWKRLADQGAASRVTFKHQRQTLSDEEIKRRAHIKRCAKACAHPNIYRDPFRVDQEGQFRLPPMPRRLSNTTSDKVRDYVYDARPVNNFMGLNTPIMVWPDEFMVFMDWEGRCEEQNKEEIKATPRRFAFLEKWLAALLAETAEEIPPKPLIKTKTARAPPCEGER